MRISDWSSDVCSSDLVVHRHRHQQVQRGRVKGAQQLFDRVFPHRGRIAEGGVGDWGSRIRGTKQDGLASLPVIPARMTIGSLAQATASLRGTGPLPRRRYNRRMSANQGIGPPPLGRSEEHTYEL